VDLVPDIGQLQYECNRLRLLATCSITNKQNYNVIDYDYIESNHDYNRDYICLEISLERKQAPFAWFDVSIFSDNVRYWWMQETKLLICKDQAPEKIYNNCLMRCSCSQQTSGVTRGLS